MSYTETVYYLTQTIRAKTEDEAREKFVQLLNDGEVAVNDSDSCEMKIEEVDRKNNG